MARYTPEGQMDQVTFASVMREAGHAKFMLAKDLLAEVPVQVVEYMRENNVQPNPGKVQLQEAKQSLQNVIKKAPTCFHKQKDLKDKCA